ncbi:MAG: hypothetical protein WCP79_00075 [Bacillota bacterium]
MKIKDLAKLQALRDKLPQDQKTETNTQIVSKKILHQTRTSGPIKSG